MFNKTFDLKKVYTNIGDLVNEAAVKYYFRSKRVDEKGVELQEIELPMGRIGTAVYVFKKGRDKRWRYEFTRGKAKGQRVETNG